MSYHEEPDAQADGWKESVKRRDVTVEEMLAQIERLDFLYDAMKPLWETIQRNLRDNTWRLPK